MNHPTEYKTFTIQLDLYGHTYRYMFYPTEQGIQHDGDMDQDGFRYTGNCKWADSIEDAIKLIDEIVPFYVKTYGPFPIGGSPQQNITKFDYLVDAVVFASKFNGVLSVSFNSI